MTGDIEQEFKKRMRESDDIDEQAAALCYEVGMAHGSPSMQGFKNIGWKDVLDLKQEVIQEQKKSTDEPVEVDGGTFHFSACECDLCIDDDQGDTDD